MPIRLQDIGPAALLKPGTAATGPSKDDPAARLRVIIDETLAFDLDTLGAR